MLDSCKMVEKQSEAFHTFLWYFLSLKQNFIAYRSSKVSDCIFEIHYLWQSDFSRVYSNSCCSCSFKLKIIKIGQFSHMMYSNNIVNFQESPTILNSHRKKCLEMYRMHLVHWIQQTSFSLINTFKYYQTGELTDKLDKQFRRRKTDLLG